MKIFRTRKYTVCLGLIPLLALGCIFILYFTPLNKVIKNKDTNTSQSNTAHEINITSAYAPTQNASDLNNSAESETENILTLKYQAVSAITVYAEQTNLSILKLSYIKEDEQTNLSKQVDLLLEEMIPDIRYAKDKAAIDEYVNLFSTQCDELLSKALNDDSKAKLALENASQPTAEAAFNESSNTNSLTINGSAWNYPDGWLTDFNQQLEYLKGIFLEGSYWNKHGSSINGYSGYMSVSDSPCTHGDMEDEYCNIYVGASSKAYKNVGLNNQCVGFASLLSDLIFGTSANVTVYRNIDNVRIGDQARLYEDTHSVFIIDVDEDYITVAECNADFATCVINWGRKIPKNQFDGYFITRW